MVIMANILKNLLRGCSLIRASMLESLHGMEIKGRVLDLGGGREHKNYIGVFSQSGEVEIETVDLSRAEVKIDFETDNLPYSEKTIDTVLALNLLEHIFNHYHILNESYRVLKPGGRFIGFVPFFIQYHPDPHDYFRYTEEALLLLMEKSGFIRNKIKIIPVGSGPFGVALNLFIPSVPKLLRWSLMIIYPTCLFGDFLFSFVSKNSRRRFPLGYIFSASK
jgi:SAM-dependent methyltransferase